MKFVECKEGLPERTEKKNLKVYFEEFMNSNIKVAKAEFNKGDYKSKIIAYKCLYNSARNYGFPIGVHKIDNEIYLVRKDI